nr:MULTISPECIES: helix-turn-helix transcriptional regulator [Providencia]
MNSGSLVSTLIGCKIKGLRRDARFTTVEFTQLIGCKSAQQLYRYEWGINKSDIDTLVSALKVLHVDIKEFFYEVMREF